MSTGNHVLVIEDQDDTRKLLAILLSRSGFEVTAYDRCNLAEAHLTACDIDVALLDVRMPGRWGNDFGRELRERCPETLIVFVTGEALVDSLKESVRNCVLMQKPIDATALLELLVSFRGSMRALDDPVVPSTA